ncbi:hypothetical protein PIB30_077456 [Stylosanthes scabra]|uniref:Uncharacterized protein n=1 Tax=Stylosanthes scabra TaxID=79078 RepID=A0ABU6SQP0_9FABA|nr:hypothetical protein [Stylosanthes scabra]
MAPRGRARTPSRGRSGARQGDPPAAAPQANSQDPKGCTGLTMSGTLPEPWERVLLPRRCAFLTPAPDVLLPFLEEVGFGHAIQLRDSCSTHRSSPPLWSAGGPRRIPFTCHGVSAPSPYRMLRTTWVFARMGILLAVAYGILVPTMSSSHGIWLSSILPPDHLCKRMRRKSPSPFG